jgi:hypothetical protein
MEKEIVTIARKHFPELPGPKSGLWKFQDGILSFFDPSYKYPCLNNIGRDVNGYAEVWDTEE